MEGEKNTLFKKVLLKGLSDAHLDSMYLIIMSHGEKSGKINKYGDTPISLSVVIIPLTSHVSPTSLFVLFRISLFIVATIFLPH